MTVRAVIVDRDMSRNHRGSVHSVFARTVNLATPDGLVTLASEAVPVGPRTAVVTGLDPQALAVGDAFDLGSIDWSSTTGWEPRLTPGEVPAEAATRLRSALDRRDATQDPFEQAAWARLDDLSSGLLNAAASRQPRAFLAVAGRIVGLGPGLTPAGDDYLAGLALGCFVTGQDAVLGWLGTAVEAHAHDTNLISLTMLREALRGRAVSPLHHLVEALTGRGDTTIEAALDAVVGIGHTSGHALASGLLAAVELTYERGNR